MIARFWLVLPAVVDESIKTMALDIIAQGLYKKLNAIHVYICLYICMYVYICLCMSMYVYIYVFICLYMFIYVYTCLYICLYMFIYMFIHVYICLHLFMYVFICLYMFIYVYCKNSFICFFLLVTISKRIWWLLYNVRLNSSTGRT